LAKSKYADNTIVILWGDHGWHLGEKLRYRKATLWREATQLPFIFHVPGMTKMQDCNRNVNLIDIYPTLIDLCNLPKKNLDGKSFAPLLKNPTKKWGPAVTTLGQGNNSVMSEKWHYIYIEKGDVEQLYNLENDPMEWTNLANISSSEIDAVKKQLRSYMPLKNADPVVNKKIEKSATGENLPKKNPDLTIKPKRILSELK